MSETQPKTGSSLLHSETLNRVLGEDVMKILRCGICMNFFEVPIVLPCGHTFCLQCLTQMCTQANVNHTPNASQDVRIGCPNCHVLIYAMPILRRNVTCNFLIQSLIDALKIREDRGSHTIASSESTGDIKNSLPSLSSLLSSSDRSPSSTENNDNHADVLRMLNNLDRVTMTLTRSNVVDRAFIEIEDIRKEHLARERQRQAERDAKTRDQIRAVQTIMKQSREEELQQRKQQQTQIQIIQQSQQVLDTNPTKQPQQQQHQHQQQQHQQQQRPISHHHNNNNHHSHHHYQPQQPFVAACSQPHPLPLNLFSAGKHSMVNPVSQESILPPSPKRPKTLDNSNNPLLPLQMQQPTLPTQQTLALQRFPTHIFHHTVNSPQLVVTSKKPQQPQPSPPPQIHPVHQERNLIHSFQQQQQQPQQQQQQQQQQQKQYQHPKPHRKAIPSNPPFEQPSGVALTPIHTPPITTPTPAQLNLLETLPPCTNEQTASNSLAVAQLLPEINPATETLPLGNEVANCDVTTARKRTRPPNTIKSATPGLHCAQAQLNNDPAVMSFSLVTGQPSASK